MNVLLVFLASALLNSLQCDYTLCVRSAHNADRHAGRFG